MQANSVRAVVLTLVAVIVGAFVSSQTHAQPGRVGPFPEPIATRDLQSYGQQLNMSREQLQAVEPFHTAYMDSFTRLRNEDIEKYLTETDGARGWKVILATREQVVDALKRRDQIVERIESLDRELFNQIESVLSEEQVVLLPRIRQQRERERYKVSARSTLRAAGPAGQVDVVELLDERELTPEQMAAIEPIIREYESSLTKQIKAAYDRCHSIDLERFDHMRAAGLDQVTAADAEKRNEFVPAYQEFWGNFASRSLEIATNISDLNRRTLSQLMAALPAKDGRELQQRYFGQAYPEAISGNPSLVNHFRIALASEGLSEKQAADIRRIEDSYHGTEDSLTGKMVDLVEEYHKNGGDTAASRKGPDGVQEARQQLDEKISAQRKTLFAAARTAVDEVRAVLNEAQFEAFAARVGDELPMLHVIHGGFVGTMVSSPGSAARLENRPPPPPFDSFISGPISRSDLDLYARLLSLDDEQKTIVESLYADYLSAFTEVQQQVLPECMQLMYKLRPRLHENEQHEEPTEQDVARLFSLRRETFARIASLDDGFFDSMQSAVADESMTEMMQRIRMLRKRAAVNPQRDSMSPNAFGGGGDQRTVEAATDLTALAWSLDAPPAIGSDADNLLLAYESQITPLFERMYELMLRMRESMAQERIKQSDGAIKMRDSGDDLAFLDTRQQLVATNRATLESLAEALPNSAQALTEAYNRRVYFMAYHDPGSMLPVLAHAFELEDLTFEQRSQLSDLAQWYRPGYEALRDRLVTLERQHSDNSYVDSPTQGTMKNVYTDRELLRKEREELNDRARLKLKGILTEEQYLAAVRGGYAASR